MQFLWSHWKKTHTKKIRVAHRDCLRSATEEIVLSYNGRNYVWTLFYYRRNGSLWRTGKRHSKISSRRWKNHEIISDSFSSHFFGYKIMEIELDTIFEIYSFWNKYLKNRGIEDPKLLGGIVTINENSQS